jgi:simple sugar transport system ATP-binding protein
MALLPPNPVLMALEQPTRGLDVDSARWIWTQLLARRAEGSIILFTSPDLDELVTYSDRILVLFAGRVHEIPDARQTTIDELGRMIGGHFEEKGGSAS